ncbi:hypothetical protein POVCU2_0071510 [Plasmodium ovale curtisi]|uniref:Uncharacterized protein n=1 Tax=Plasmodium ovale curtisi TaxID=864141 RepID=A0A1A8VZ60_PLAOA|nr:hypothetical protein POVCU1_012960 [Plasmodium ovale curtisi]SBS92016.1 hypothetical protein POVCU2_0071510 [Plasmodium ovale curtisi]
MKISPWANSRNVANCWSVTPRQSGADVGKIYVCVPSTLGDVRNIRLSDNVEEKTCSNLGFKNFTKWGFKRGSTLYINVIVLV